MLACPSIALAEDSWDVRASLGAYFLSNQADYLQPTVAVDHGALHLEGRYNYEAQRTGSVWVGRNFEWGESLKVTLTPVVVGVIGNLHGIAPGVEADLSWGPVEFYWEGEYVFDVVNWPAIYFLTQSELSARPFEWLRAGVAAQRNRALNSPRLAQWGPLVGVSVWKVSADAYWFNPGQADSQYWVASLEASF